MALLTTGKTFIRDLEQSGSLALYAPLEGGFEGRYRRRVRAAGYNSLCLYARGIGDVADYLTGVHGVRPPRVGEKVSRTYYLPQIVTSQIQNMPTKSNGEVVWIITSSL